MSETVRIGILGCGNVGGPLVGLIDERARAIEARTGLRLQVARVAVRNLSRERAVPIPDGLLTRDAAEVVEDPTIDLIVEVIGGIEPARELILTALKHGKPVVTANKELLANVGAEVFSAADAAGCDLLFEAAVAGGIPLVRALRESLAGEPVRRIMGIVNGTTNFILTRMTDAGASYGDALSEAQSLGYAERDPTADVEGYDAGAKAAIITSIAFGVRVVAGDVYHEGISQITADDIAAATRLGYVVKLLAIAERFDDGALAVRVHPAMVPVAHPLASVRDSYNAVFVEGDAVGSLMFYGRGAGGRPTASAVLGDVIDAASNLRKGTHAIDRDVRARSHAADRRDERRVLHPARGRRPARRAPRGHRCVRGARRLDPHGGAGRPRRRRSPRVHHAHRARGRRAGDVARPPRPRRREAGRQHLARRRHQLVKYVSTRGAAPVVDFAGAMLGGLASDGGLYVPESWPALPAGLRRAAPYAETAAEVIWPFVDGIDRDALVSTCVEAYATFRHDAVCPLVQLSDDTWLLELFHGPTLAFKDVALQLVGRLMDDELGRRGERTSIVVATSGDTGSAAIEACRGRDNLEIFVLHPAGRVSEVQRRQMTTVVEPNVHNIALEGTFDDCQDMVKALFADAAFREEHRLGALNSINWARVVAQVVYYVTAADVARRDRDATDLVRRADAATSATCSRGGSPSRWACRSTSSSSARIATTSSPGSSTTGAWRSPTSCRR